MSDLQRTAIQLDYGFQGFNLLTAGQTTDLTDNIDGYYAIKALETSTIDATSVEGDSLTNQQIIVTDVLFGYFSSVTCDSGTILVYYK